MIEIIRYFLDNTIMEMNNDIYNLSYIKFVFNDDFFDEVSKYDNIYTINYLKNVKNNYDLGLINEDDIYIKVDDYKKFFNLLNELVSIYDKRKYKGLYCSFDLMRSIWLRMSPIDINNVNMFLIKQLEFIKNDELLSYNMSFFKSYEDVDIYYQNKSNDEWFETNNNITFSFFNKEEMDNYRYDLPSIHYALDKENNLSTCYIYGIQNLSDEKNKIIKDKIHLLRKELHNKYVSPDFVLSLKLFTEFLKSKEIYSIRVPLLQVFNYQYHKNLSKIIEKAYLSYENKEELENRYKNGNRDDFVLDYIHDKKMYEKFVNKEDLISKNKTERLVNTFLVLNEIYDDIEILNDTFIQGDYLIINIKNTNKKLKI